MKLMTLFRTQTLKLEKSMTWIVTLSFSFSKQRSLSTRWRNQTTISILLTDMKIIIYSQIVIGKSIGKFKIKPKNLWFDKLCILRAKSYSILCSNSKENKLKLKGKANASNNQIQFKDYFKSLLEEIKKTCR